MSEIEIPLWLISFFTALSATFFGYLIAVKKFKNEKIWQEKYQAYQNILSALETMLLWANDTYCENKFLPTIGTDKLPFTEWQSFSNARREIFKSSCIGKLLLPDEVVIELNNLESKLWDEDMNASDDYCSSDKHQRSEMLAEHARNIENIIQPRLKNIISYAKKDLK